MPCGLHHDSVFSHCCGKASGMNEFTAHRFVYRYSREELDSAAMRLYSSKFSSLCGSRQQVVRNYLRKSLEVDKAFVGNKDVMVE